MAFFLFVTVDAGSNTGFDNRLVIALPHWQTAFSSWATRSRRYVFCWWKTNKNKNILSVRKINATNRSQFLIGVGQLSQLGFQRRHIVLFLFARQASRLAVLDHALVFLGDLLLDWWCRAAGWTRSHPDLMMLRRGWNVANSCNTTGRDNGSLLQNHWGGRNLDGVV